MRKLVLFLLLWPGFGWAQTEVEAAYKAIPHRYTPFEATQAKMSSAEKAYLDKAFALVNRAVVARVAGGRGRYADYDNEAAAILAEFASLHPPKKLAKFQQLVVGAIEDQRAYFQQRAAQPASKFAPGDPLVRSSSGKLRQAYGLLMKQYPGQAKRIQEAFFDHLCALDFI